MWTSWWKKKVVDSMKFIPQLEMPKKGDKYYNTKSNGGINPCIKGSPTVKGLDVLCNCVGYEVGRFNSESGQETCCFFGSMDAKSFYSYAIKWGLPVSDTPVLGACACWSGGKDGRGHVGNVEEVDEQQYNCSISSSGYKSYEWKLTKNCNKDNNYGMSKSYKFLGFVKNPNLDIETDKEKIEKAIKKLDDARLLINDAELLLKEVE